MFKCHVCGGEKADIEHVSDVFKVDERRVLVENIPVMVCERCGDMSFSRETTESVRRLVHEHGKPLKTVELEIFALAES